MSFITRFAPSPTGPLHLGHAYSALLALHQARLSGGRFLLRIEDIDRARSRARWEAQIYDDLAWLGISWETPVMRQSDNMPAYNSALRALWSQGLLYACQCNRRDILAAASAPQEGAPLTGPDGVIYPGTCRDLPRDPGVEMPKDKALRLDLRAAAEVFSGPLSYVETGRPGPPQTVTADIAALQQSAGDVVVARRDMGTSYHLSVVIDDAAQQISDVVRGEDLAEATMIHVLLQHLLGLPVPRYHHHRLIRDEAGRRLAKRDDARAIATYREAGATPQDIRCMVGL
ncbi:tRNA glutamyl-Q(34) synthetase GluQRS [Roseobacter ponti]|uniref:tRNA glutamyl-Q(34) synthetase GluQRS n=1 Tax=Roseobacter ponti TaxID=1891787 RepID=A0A858SR53_9RHOB|nr:tRNA glutamyl-Q(34) synthetase GluQRS [Roseobacter ponti]QJF51349.1 tRNA glutamyl-Q(34) synthetase GluQRS [Roseobacter ponti]